MFTKLRFTPLDHFLLTATNLVASFRAPGNLVLRVSFGFVYLHVCHLWTIVLHVGSCVIFSFKLRLSVSVFFKNKVPFATIVSEVPTVSCITLSHCT